MYNEDIFNDIEGSFTMLRDIIKKFPDRYNQNDEEIKSFQNEIQDYLHLLEMNEFNAYQGYKISKNLQNAQIERRYRKDENELLEKIIPVIKKFRNNLKQMDEVIGSIREVKDKQNNRRYHCKVRKDLQDNFDQEKIINL